MNSSNKFSFNLRKRKARAKAFRGSIHYKKESNKVPSISTAEFYLQQNQHIQSDQKLQKAEEPKSSNQSGESTRYQFRERASNLIAKLTYTVVDTVLKYSENSPVAKRLIKFFLKGSYDLKATLESFFKRIKLGQYKIVYIPILILFILPIVLVTVFIISSMFGISSITIAFLTISSLGAFFVISLFFIPLILIITISVGLIILLSSLCSMSWESLFKTLFISDDSQFKRRLRNFADDFPKPLNESNSNKRQPPLSPAVNHDDSIAKMLIGEEHIKISDGYDVVPNDNKVAKDLDEIINEGKLFKLSNIVEDTEIESSPLVQSVTESNVIQLYDSDSNIPVEAVDYNELK